MKDIVYELCSYSDEEEWFEIDQLGEYISAISNASAVLGKKEGYFVWGINDKNHNIVGTTINYHGNYRDEPLQNYLARNLTPCVRFRFEELNIDSKRVVVLIIPAATDIPTSFKDRRYIRIGSSKLNLNLYPKREKELFKILESGIPTIENTVSKYQDFNF